MLLSRARCVVARAVSPAFCPGATAVRANAPRGFRAMSTYYTKEHEYVKLSGDVGTVGITDFAQNQLGDVVYVELPNVGDSVSKGDTFGSVESVKAASDLYAPVSGEIVGANDALSDNPGLINESPLDKGWVMKIKLSDKDELNGLLDEQQYKKHCEEEEH